MGEGCDPCTNVGGGQDLLARSKVIVMKINADTTPGNDKLLIKGDFVLSPATSFQGLDPLNGGARIILQNAARPNSTDVTLPTGAYSGAGTAGWKAIGSPVRKWLFRDTTGSPANGIKTMAIRDRSSVAPRRVGVVVRGKNGSYPVGANDPPLRAIVVLGASPTAADLGACGESAFGQGACTFNGPQTTLKCTES